MLRQISSTVTVTFPHTFLCTLSWIFQHLNVGVHRSAVRNDNRHVKPQSSVRPAWHKVTENDIENYHDMLNQNLHNIYIPISYIECHDYFCVNETYRSDITRYCNELITSCLSAGRSVFPMCFPRKPLKPYFNNINKEQSLLWLAISISLESDVVIQGEYGSMQAARGRESWLKSWDKLEPSTTISYAGPTAINPILNGAGWLKP